MSPPRSLLSVIDWVKRQGRDGPGVALLPEQDRSPEACEHLSISLDCVPAGIPFPARRRAVQMLGQLDRVG